MDLEQTKYIISKYKYAKVIPIRHYKDVFNKNAQAPHIQAKSKKLILAKKPDSFIYKGSPVCQSFDNEYFYYQTSALNCIFDCEYCFLKGFYPSSNLVFFLNIEDCFKEMDEITKDHEAYVSISYNTDLVPLEPLLGHIDKWLTYLEGNPKATAELRTKAGHVAILENVAKNHKRLDQMVIAVSLCPEEIKSMYEHVSPAISARLNLAKRAKELGFQIRLCFDPMIYDKNYKEYYVRLLEQINETLDITTIKDVAVGSFRIAKDYLKSMRNAYPDYVIPHFPYELSDGFYQYPYDLSNEMESFLIEELKKYVSEDKIFTWKEDDNK